MTDDFYRGLVSRLKCTVPLCGVFSCDPHHVKTGGVGMKCCDSMVIPLCRGHHNELHNIGKSRFAEKYSLPPWDVIVKETQEQVLLRHSYSPGGVSG